MSLSLLRKPVLESPLFLTIGLIGCLRRIFVLRDLFLHGPSSEATGGSFSAEDFFHAALAWFGDPDPRVGTAVDRSERLANLIADRRTLLVLDGLESFQYPSGPQEGRMREPSLRVFLHALAALNSGLCVAASQLAVADLADYEPAQFCVLIFRLGNSGCFDEKDWTSSMPP